MSIDLTITLIYYKPRYSIIPNQFGGFFNSLGSASDFDATAFTKVRCPSLLSTINHPEPDIA